MSETHQKSCDFCSGPNPCWSYTATDFTVLQVLVSQGSWDACDECAALIERNDREGLVVRAVNALIAIHPNLAAERAWCLTMARRVHEDFWANRTGPVRAEGVSA